MGFQNGNTYGTKTKRGVSKITEEVKERLETFSDSAFIKLAEGIERGEFQYIKLWFNYRYGLPHSRAEVDLTGNVIQPIEIILNGENHV